MVVSKIFYFHPYLGKWWNLTNFFSNGLKPPIRSLLTTTWIQLRWFCSFWLLVGWKNMTCTNQGPFRPLECSMFSFFGDDRTGSFDLSMSDLKITRWFCWWWKEIRRWKPVEAGSLSHVLQGFIYPTGGWPWDFWTINSITLCLLIWSSITTKLFSRQLEDEVFLCCFRIFLDWYEIFPDI